MSEVVNTTRTLERKAREFDANKKALGDRISEGIKIAKAKLDRVEMELLEKLEAFFGSNVYSEQIVDLDASDPASLKKAVAVAAFPVPESFGPSEEDFGRLFKEIGRLASKTYPRSVTPPAPENPTVQGVGKNGFYDGVSLSWPAVVPEAGSGVECVRYKVHMVNENNAGRTYDSTKTSCAFQNLKPGTMYAFSAQCIWDEKAGPWSSAVEFTTSPVPIVTNAKIKKRTDCSVTVTWDPAPVEVVWEVEIRKDEPFSEFKKAYEGSDPSCTLKSLGIGTEYLVRLRARLGGNSGDWSDEFAFKTKKWTCGWKQCPENAVTEKRYVVSGKDGKKDNLATSASGGQNSGSNYPIVIGTNPIPLGTTVSWKVNLEYGGDSESINFFVGIAPIDIDQNDQYIGRRATYIYTYNYYVSSGYGYVNIVNDLNQKLSSLCNATQYYSMNYIQKPPYICVTVDTRKGKITFFTNSTVLGTVRQIPLDTPLVPFVQLGRNGSSAELEI